MFDQSLLALAAPRTNKTWTMAVSLVGQVLLVVIVCLLPLIYTDQLQGVTKWSGKLMLPSMPRAIETHQEVTMRPIHEESMIRTPITIPRGVPDVHDLPAAIALNAPSGPGVAGAVPGDRTSDIGRVIESLLPAARPPAPPPPPAPAPPQTAEQRMRVSSGVQEAKLLRRIVPVYPPIAIAARVQGTVHLIGVVAKDGTVRDLQVLDGNPLLVRSAVDAARQWIYKPTLLNGEPVEVVAPINVTFVLNR